MLGVRPAEGCWAYRRPVLGVRFRAKAAQAAAGIGVGSPALVLSRNGGQVHLAGMPTVIWIQFRLASTGPAGSSISPAAVSSSTSRPGDQQQDDQHRARTGVERQVPAGRTRQAGRAGSFNLVLLAARFPLRRPVDESFDFFNHPSFDLHVAILKPHPVFTSARLRFFEVSRRQDRPGVTAPCLKPPRPSRPATARRDGGALHGQSRLPLTAA